MKKETLLYVALGAVTFSLASCDDFLNTMPDNRAEIDTESKVASMLVSAYSDKSTILMTEYGTDNVMDNGAQYASSNKSKEEVYLWQTITSESNDDPKYVWQSGYSAIAAANQALHAIDNMGNPENLASQRAEALLCRAYGHFALANVFCQAYNPETADKEMGIPYSEKPETGVMVQYDRGTMAALYQKINDDIEAALPYVRDDVYAVPKYHFNRKAAYAFAARFNLFYVKADKSNYQKVVDYATQVVGNTPGNVLRKMTDYLPLGATDIGNAYVQASQPANLLIIPCYSLAGRLITGTSPRYNHAREITSNETMWATGAWGSGGSSAFLISRLFGSNQSVYFPKVIEFWEYTDKTGGTGYAHTVTIPFTADETLLCRAEAYVFLEKYGEAAADLNAWQVAHCNASYKDNAGVVHNLATLTPQAINDFYNNLAYTPVPPKEVDGVDRTIKKTLHPQGFTVAQGQQENFIQCVLHYRRIESLHDGLRWLDIKRYGIEVAHNRDGLDTDILKVGDLRRAIQLPNDVINAGLTANPR